MTIVTTSTDDAEAMRVLIERQLLNRDYMLPCVVRAVSSDGTTVDVTPAISKSKNMDGTRTPLEEVLIKGVPIALYGSSTLGLFACPPIRPGDDGVIWAADRAIDDWQHGEGVQMAPPMATPRSGDFTDALFYPGAQRKSGAIQSFPSDRFTIQNRAGTTVASVKDDEVSIVVGTTRIVVTPAGVEIVGNVTHTGDTMQTGAQETSGPITVGGALSANGGATVAGDVAVEGNVDIVGNSNQTGTATLQGAMQVTGIVTAKDFVRT